MSVPTDRGTGPGMSAAAPGSRARPDEVSDRAWDMYLGLKDAGVGFSVSLPETVLTPVIHLLRDDPDVVDVVCTREDEGLAMAAGAWLGGRLPVALMEGSGLGYSGLILARMQICRIPCLVLAGHNRALGEIRDYHQASSLAAEGVLRGLDIPFVVIDNTMDLRWVARQAASTVRAQKTSVGLLVPMDLLH